MMTVLNLILRHKMEERNAQIEKEDEEKKAEELKERKRKVLGML